MRIKKEITMEITANEIWEELDDKDIQDLKEQFYEEFKEEYKQWLIEEGELNA